jgi:hypothetical protein
VKTKKLVRFVLSNKWASALVGLGAVVASSGAGRKWK